MFRKMRRWKQETTEERCVEILTKEKRGVLAVLGDDGYPYALPIDYLYDADNNRIYFHGASSGHKMDAISRCDKVSFCVYDEGYQVDGEWPLHITSVIVFGRISVIEDRAQTIEIARRIGRKYYPDYESVEIELEKTADRVTCLCLNVEHMSGKLVKES